MDVMCEPDVGKYAEQESIESRGVGRRVSKPVSLCVFAGC